MAAGFFGKLWGKVKQAAGTVANTAKKIAGKAWDGIKTVGGGILSKAGGQLASGAAGMIGDMASGIGSGDFRGAATSAFNKFKDGAMDVGRDALSQGITAGRGIAQSAMRDAAGAIGRVPGYG